MTLTHIIVALIFFVTVQSAEWGYEDPSEWYKKFPICNKNRQSPVALITSMTKYDSSLYDFSFHDYDKANINKVENNGHTIQVSLDYGPKISGGNLPGTYEAVQFHFHWHDEIEHKGSEHTLNGREYPLELHIVHKKENMALADALNDPEGLAVLGFFFEVGKENKGIDKFLNKRPKYDKAEVTDSMSLTDIIGHTDHLKYFYRYPGSLTTPPCSEAVIWSVFHQVFTLSKAQMEIFWNTTDAKGKTLQNYRPIQPLNGRTVITNFPSSERMYTDPKRWHEAFPDCNGQSQSPIDINTTLVDPDSDLKAIKFVKFNKISTFSIVNNGHSLQLSLLSKPMSINGGGLPNTYNVLQFHFHWNTNSNKSGSEHKIDGGAYPLEMHIVCQNSIYKETATALQNSDGLAVLGFFFELGSKRNLQMDKVLEYAEKSEEQKKAVEVPVNLAQLIGLNGSKMDGFYRYDGSLTTPPCSEVVTWTIFKKTLRITQDQLEIFWKLRDHYGHWYSNFRPIQDLNSRIISRTT